MMVGNKTKAQLEDEGSVGFGIDTEIISGVKSEAKLTGRNNDVRHPTVMHDCMSCADGEAKLVTEYSYKVYAKSYGANDWLVNIKNTISLADCHLYYFYNSFDHKKWDYGE